MAIVEKGNKQLTIDETAVCKYLAQGYCEIDAEGNIIKEATAKKTVSIESYNSIKAELEKLKAKKSKAEKSAE